MFAKNTALILGYSIACLGCSGEETNSDDGMTSVTGTDSTSSAPVQNPSATGPSNVGPAVPNTVNPTPVPVGPGSGPGVGGAEPVGAGGEPVTVPVGNGGMPGPVGISGAGPTPTEPSGQGNAGESAGVAGAGAGGSGTAGANAGGAGVGAAGAGAGGAGVAGAGEAGAGNGGSGGAGDVIDTGAADNFSFFITSYFHILELSGSEDGFGGDLRYNGAATGLEGADAICQEMARRVGFGHRTWRAFLSTSTVDAIDRIGAGPWYDFSGSLLAENVEGLTSGDRAAGGANENGTYDELGTFHDGETDVNNDGIDDDDHDTMTATNADGTYAGFSCDDWTSTTAEPEGGGQGGPGGGFGSGIMMGHSWPAQSGQSWVESHAGHACAAGTNFIQDGPGDSSTVGGGGGYGGFYCFALPE